MTYHRSRSHWFNEASAYNPSPPLQGERHVDVCIIGGGITGLSTAYHLRKLDKAVDVALLEAEVVGFGASGRNAGQLIVAFGGMGLGAAIRKFGAARVGEAWAYIAEGIDTIERLIREEDAACDYMAVGCMETGLKIDGQRVVDRHMQHLEDIGQLAYMQYMSPSDVAAEIESPYLGAAVLDPRGGQFDPIQLVRGIKQAALRHGAQIYEDSPAVSIDTGGEKIVVWTGQGVLKCKRLVLATNAYTGLLPNREATGVNRRQHPMIVHASVTEPLSAQQWDDVRWHRRSGVNLLSDMFYSFAPTSDGRLLYVGGHYVSLATSNHISAEVDLRFLSEGSAHLTAFFPTLKGLRTTQTWGGAVSTTADFIPHVGVNRSDPRILHAYGCWGHGMPLGTRNGQTLAELILDRDTDSTNAWFVQRRKARFPHRTVASLVSRPMIARRQAINRRIGNSMTPPIGFGH